MSGRIYEGPVRRRPVKRVAGLVLAAMMGAASASADGIAEADLERRALAIAEEVVTRNHIVTEERLTSLQQRAAAASGTGRLEYLYEALNESVRLRQRRELAHAAAVLRAEAARQGNRRYLSLANVYSTYAQSLSGRLKETLADLEAMLAIDANREDWLVSARIRQFIAAVAPTLGQVHRSARSLRDAFQGLPHDDPEAVSLKADLLVALGILDAQLHDPASMISQFEQALALAVDIGWTLDGTAMLYNLATAFLQEGRVETAREIFLHLHDLAGQRGRSKDRFFALYGLMKVAHEAGDLAASNVYARRAVAEDAPPPDFAAVIAQYRVLNHIALGNRAEAERQFSIARAELARWPDYEDSEYAARHLLLQSRLAEMQGRFEEALALYKRYAQEFAERTRETFTRDIKALRAELEADLASAEMRRRVAEREQAVARESMRVQQLWLTVLVALTLLAVVSLAYQRRMTRALDESRRRAVAASEAKSRFLANVSHELRTPLNAIIGFSEMTAKEMLGPIGNPSYRGYADAIHRSGRHLLAVINDILDLSRVESGQVELEEQVVPVARFIEEAAEMVLVRAEDRRQRIAIDIPPGLPDVRVDSRLMRQTLSNLLFNAIKFSPEGSIIRVGAVLTESGEIEISVRDPGIGMSDEEIRLALEPFGQVRSERTRHNDGAGLGLPLVETLVRRHGGRLLIRSRKGSGTKVAVVLPADRVLPAGVTELPMQRTVVAGA